MCPGVMFTGCGRGQHLLLLNVYQSICRYSPLPQRHCVSISHHSGGQHKKNIYNTLCERKLFLSGFLSTAHKVYRIRLRGLVTLLPSLTKDKAFPWRPSIGKCHPVPRATPPHRRPHTQAEQGRNSRPFCPSARSFMSRRGGNSSPWIAP